MNDLHGFYSGILQYAFEHYIYLYSCDLGNFYKIMFDNLEYEIGIFFRQEISCFCKRVFIKKKEEFLEFQDILEKKTKTKIEKNEYYLNQLSDIVMYLYEKKIPLEAIKITLKNTLDELNKKEEEKQLKKK